MVSDRWSSGKYTHDPRRVSREKELRELLQEEQPSRTVASSLVCTSPLTVITIVGLLDVLMVSKSADLMSLADRMPSGSFVDAARSTHSSAGDWNVALSFSSSLFMFLARSQALLRAHRWCHSVSSWDRPSKFIGR